MVTAVGAAACATLGLAATTFAPSGEHGRFIERRFPSASSVAVVFSQDAAANDEHAAFASFASEWCIDCHRGARAKGGLRIDEVLDAIEGGERPGVLRSMVQRMDAREMPPDDFRPSDEAYLDAVLYLESVMSRAGEVADPGAPMLRRLNRTEYVNAVRDLFGVDLDPEAVLPLDDVGHGFDNNGDVLSIPPLLFEKYMDLAEMIARRAFAEIDPLEITRTPIDFADLELEPARSGRIAPRRALLWSNAALRVPIDVPRPGLYRLRFDAWGDQAGPQPVRLEVAIDRDGGRRVLRTIDVPERADAPSRHLFDLTLDETSAPISISFINDYYDRSMPEGSARDRNAWVGDLIVEGPLDQPEPTTLQQRLAAHLDTLPTSRRADRAGRARETAAYLGERAWRRPLTDIELDRLIDVATGAARADEGLPSETRVARTILVALLAHPRFLFRLETEPGVDEPFRRLDGYEIASRLAAFLWASVPDDDLREAAVKGTLDDASGRRRVVAAMLDDPRAFALAEHFAAQWLRIRALSERMPDPDRFPGVDDALLEAMRIETILVFDAIQREGRPLWELFSADWTYLNERLAAHYGVPGVRGAHMRRVSLANGSVPGVSGARPGDSLGLGVLRHGSVLVATSNPTRTSPVKRGKWVLEALFDAPPPPPPPDIPALPGDGHADATLTLREQMERHRADPRCATCHIRMDAIGFAMEPLDAVGRWRAQDGANPIDAAGELPDGTLVEGPFGLRDMLLGQREVLRSFVVHLATWALGRGLEPEDEPFVANVVNALEDDPTIERAILEIVESSPFLLRGHRRVAEDDSVHARKDPDA